MTALHLLPSVPVCLAICSLTLPLHADASPLQYHFPYPSLELVAVSTRTLYTLWYLSFYNKLEKSYSFFYVYNEVPKQLEGKNCFLIHCL